MRKVNKRCANRAAQALLLSDAELRTSQSALGAYQGEACYEDRYRERVLHQLSQRTNKLGMQLGAAPQAA